jgi:flagellar protein FliO/FliZ
MRAFSASSVLLFCFLCLLAMPSGLMAAEEIVPGSGVSGSEMFWKTLAMLVFIVILLFILAALGKRFLAHKTFGQSTLKLLGGLTLGPREQIFMVEAGEDLLIIGVVPGQIRTLHRMKKQAEPGALSGDEGASASTLSAPASFARALADAVRQFRTPHEKT